MKTILQFVFVVSVALSASMGFSQANLPAVADLPERPLLPDPFTLNSGEIITTQEQWFSLRRPEIITMIQHYMYGYIPNAVTIETNTTNRVEDVLGGKATLHEIELRFADFPAEAPHIHLALFTPNHVDEPVPVFLALNKCGNQMVLPDERITIQTDTWLHSQCPNIDEPLRGTETGFWCIEQLIERGYAFATFHESDIDPDTHDFEDGIHPHFTELPGEPDNHWGTIAAWAWGLHRAIDCLVKIDQIAPDEICLIGHSRRGKAALFAAAMDDRVALVVPHQSGTGGAALNRNNDQETVERINRVFPHWFNDAFTQFNDNEQRLPFDQHLLMAMVAPRALIDGAGLEDTWANYESAMVALRAADDVYEFLGYEGIAGNGIINTDNEVPFAQAGQVRIDAGHTLNSSFWSHILDAADTYFSSPRPALARTSEAYPTTGSIERADEAINDLIPEDAVLEVVARGFDWSEGPLWVKDGGYLLFSDIPPNRIYRWKENDGLRLYLHPAGYTGETDRGGEPGSNGLLIDDEGRLVLCQHGDRRMAWMDAPLSDPAPNFVTLADRYDGKRFNSPNDAVFHRNGDLFFTDPPYGLVGYVDDPAKEIEFQGVYRLTSEGHVHLVTDDLPRPNGIAFSPDYRTLYVANSHGEYPVWTAFDVDEDGVPSNPRPFFDSRSIDRRGGGDGLKVDKQGNVFATGPGGVLVLSPDGDYLGTIRTGRATSNCAFGEDGSTLFITADDLLLRVRLSTTGMGF